MRRFAMKRCTRCVTPDTYPGITLNRDGVCAHCLEYEEAFSDWGNSQQDRTAQFHRLLELARKKSKTYDVLVPLSGGKDSTYVLYLAAIKYGLKVLCYNFDNGFKSEVAHRNIESAVRAAGADLIVVKPHEELLVRLYRHFLEHTGMFCPVCMRGIYYGQFLTARQFRIPLVLNGTSQRTEEYLVPEIFQDGRLSFFANVLRRHPFSEDIRPLFCDRSPKEKVCRALYILSKGKLFLGSIDVHLPDFLEWDYKHIYAVIRDEMGWNPLPDRDEHVDCLAEPAAHYLRQLRCPDLTPSTLRYSAEIRSGQMDRSHALKIVEKELRDGFDKTHVAHFLDRLGITFDDLDAHMTNNLRHMAFQKDSFAVSAFNKIRSLL
jgi:hypothetical protein